MQATDPRSWVLGEVSPYGTTGPNQEIQIAGLYPQVMTFPEQPPKLGVARSNRARVTTLSFSSRRDRQSHCPVVPLSLS